MDERTIVTKRDVRTRMLQERSRLARDPGLQRDFRTALESLLTRLPRGLCAGGYVPFRGEPDITESLLARDHFMILALPYSFAEGRMVYLRRGTGDLEKDALGVPAPKLEGGSRSRRALRAVRGVLDARPPIGVREGVFRSVPGRVRAAPRDDRRCVFGSACGNDALRGARRAPRRAFDRKGGSRRVGASCRALRPDGRKKAAVRLPRLGAKGKRLFRSAFPRGHASFADERRTRPDQ